jgi:hypothetical protein
MMRVFYIFSLILVLGGRTFAQSLPINTGRDFNLHFYKGCDMVEFSMDDMGVYNDSIHWTLIQLCDTCRQIHYDCWPCKYDTIGRRWNFVEYYYSSLALDPRDTVVFDPDSAWHNRCIELGWNVVIDTMKESIILDYSNVARFGHFFVFGIVYHPSGPYFVWRHFIVQNKKYFKALSNKVLQCSTAKVFYWREFILYSHSCSFQRITF